MSSSPPAIALRREACPSCPGGRDAVRLRLDFLVDYPPELCLVRCRRCGTERIDPHPSAEVMSRHYDRAYYEEGYLPFVDRRRADFRRRLREVERCAAVAAARQSRRPLRCLDLGAGIGLFALEAGKLGWQVTGVEPSAPARELAAELWSVELSESPPAAAADFDLVTLWDVLGHVDEPRRMLALARDHLRPGGTLVLKIPNFQSSWHRVRGWMSARRRVNLLHAPTVIWRFNRHGLARLLSRNGFALDQVRTIREPDLLPLTGRWRAVRAVTSVLDASLDNRQEMILYAHAR